MNARRSRKRRLFGAAADLGAALVATVIMVGIAGSGLGAVPALGVALSPGTGVWSDARDAALPTDGTWKLPGMSGPAAIAFEDNGFTHITANTDDDMFRAIGYAHGRFRLFQMDLLRRQASGRLSEILGEQALESDKYELDLGLLRAATRDRDTQDPASPAAGALEAYAQGVNGAIEQMESDGTLPSYFKLLGYHPEPWSAVDSFLVQRLMTQTLSLDLRPLTYSFLADAMGAEAFDRWFPAVPWHTQYPYDPGPYVKEPLEPLPPSDPAAPTPDPAGVVPAGTPPAADGSSTAAASAILERTRGLPSNAEHTIGNSNVWVVSGSRTASGKPVLAADPHLQLTLPSVWFEMSARGATYDMTGVSLPGMPVVLIGKTPHISFGIANSQHQGTIFYLEETDEAHPDQYFWKGSWRPMTTLDYRIKVKGSAPVDHQVRLTTHGPIITDQGKTASIWWEGMLPSDNLNSALNMVRARNFDQFRSALKGWRTPSENFAYADRSGDIGIVNAGYAPQVASGRPYLPMPGTGEYDVIGTIPVSALPVTHNPDSGFAAASNDREVTADYPYYYGRAHDFFDQGWRQSLIVGALEADTAVSIQSTTALQLSDVDGPAPFLAPSLLAALESEQLTPQESRARDVLASWDYRLDKDSEAPLIWLKFVRLYEYAVFKPWWEHYQVPVPPRDDLTPSRERGGYAMEALRGMLVKLTAKNPTDPLFTGPGSAGRNANELMAAAFKEAVKGVAGNNKPASPKVYGDGHQLMIASLLQNATLDAGPYPADSGGRAINSVLGHVPVRDGKPLAGVVSGGASYRLIVDWGTEQTVSSYPGGADENPASPWYATGVDGWLNGRYQQILEGADAEEATKGRTWTLLP